MKTIGGFVFAHNAIEHDYCLEQSVRAMSSVCDRVIVADCESCDGTLDLIHGLSEELGNIQVETLRWSPNSGGWGSWLGDLANECRRKLETDFWFHLQADEVISEDSFDVVSNLRNSGSSYWFRRNNYWTSPYLLTPVNRVCSSSIIRFSKASDPICGDGESAAPNASTKQSDIVIHHYGFLRKPEGFAKKARKMEAAYTGGSYNPIIDKVEKEGMKKLRDDWSDPLVPFNGSHPKSMIPWLIERGWEVML